MLIDLDAAARIGVERVGRKHSSAYDPPEGMVAIAGLQEVSVRVRVRVRVRVSSLRSLRPAPPPTRWVIIVRNRVGISVKIVIRIG